LNDDKAHLTREQLEYNRTLLLVLMQISRDITGHTQSLQNVWLLAKPSQKFPKYVSRFKKEDKKGFSKESASSLIEASRTYDAKSSELLDTLVEEIEQLKNSLNDECHDHHLSDELREKMGQFSDVTQTAVLIRLLLQDEGIVLPYVKFSIPAELIGEHVESVLEASKTLKNRVIMIAIKVASDITQLLGLEAVSSKQQKQLEAMRHAIELAATSYKKSGDIRELFSSIESLSIESANNSPGSKPVENRKPEESQIGGSENTKKKPSNFFQKLTIWLNSGWKKKWKDIM